MAKTKKKTKQNKKPQHTKKGSFFFQSSGMLLFAPLLTSMCETEKMVQGLEHLLLDLCSGNVGGAGDQTWISREQARTSPLYYPSGSLVAEFKA